MSQTPGLFDASLSPQGLFDDSVSPGGMFDKTLIIIASGTLYTQSLIAAIAACSGSEVKKTLSAIAAKGSALSGSITRKTKTVFAAVSSSFNGKAARKILAALTAKSAALNGLVVRKMSILFSALSTAFSGSTTRKTLLVITSKSSAINALLTKKSSVVLSSIASALSGTLSSAKAFVLNLAAEMSSFVGAITKNTTVSVLATTASFSGSIIKQAQMSLLAVSYFLSAAVLETEEGGTSYQILAAVSNVFSAVLIRLHILPAAIVEPWMLSLPFSEAIDLINNQSFPIGYRIGAASIVKLIMQQTLNRYGGSTQIGVAWMIAMVNYQMVNTPGFAQIYDEAPIIQGFDISAQAGY